MYLLIVFSVTTANVTFRDATGTVKKSRKVSGDRGQRRGGGSRGRSPLEARAFSQSELPRKPPIDTHGRYTYNTCTGKEKKKKKKVGIPTEVGKTASLYIERVKPCLILD